MKAMQAQQPPPEYDQSGSFQTGGPGLFGGWFPQGGESQPPQAKPPEYDQSGSFQTGGPGLWGSWLQQQMQRGESQPLPPTQGGQLGMAMPEMQNQGDGRSQMPRLQMMAQMLRRGAKNG